MAGIESPEYQVNVSQENLINKFAVQGEENSRMLTLHLVENVQTVTALQQTEIRQKPLDLTGCTARLYTKKPDGNATFINGTIVANGADGNPNTVTFVLTQQTTAAAGNAHCTVAIFGSNGTELKATGITLDIATDDMEQTIVSTSEFVSLAEALGSVQESEQKADKAVSDSQTAVTNATTAITDITQKQAAMDTAESNRVTAESGRVTAESGRVAAEQSRIAAEQTRQTAETKRETDSQAAITAANAATEKASHVPQRDASGVWKDWDTESQTYKNSADQWKGEKGDTGAAFAYGESYTTVDALQAAYLTGDTKGHLVNGTAYVWDGTAWVATSVSLTDYQLKSQNPTAGQKAGTTLGDHAVCMGRDCTASGHYSTASGLGSTTSGYASTASGWGCVASGYCSTALGGGSTALGYCSTALGYCSVAHDKSEFSMGEYNKNSVGNPSEFSTTNDALVIGNGTSDTARSNCFRVKFNGSVYGLSAFNSSGADYSEYFEWLDGNPNKEDRVGRLVTLDGEKIRYAKPDDDVLGIVSALPAIIGDSPADSWKERYACDVFGRRILEEVTIPAQPAKMDENGVEIMPAIPEHTETRFKVNPNYDPTKENEYENREKRPEWSTVGMLGKLVLIDDGTCAVNGYAQPAATGDGTATKSDTKTNCRVMTRLDSTHIKVLLK